VLDVHLVLRLIANILGLFFGYLTFNRVRHVGVLALVLSTAISILLGLGIAMNVIDRTCSCYAWMVDVIRILATVGLYHVWQSIRDNIE